MVKSKSSAYVVLLDIPAIKKRSKRVSAAEANRIKGRWQKDIPSNTGRTVRIVKV